MDQKDRVTMGAFLVVETAPGLREPHGHLLKVRPLPGLYDTEFPTASATLARALVRAQGLKSAVPSRRSLPGLAITFATSGRQQVATAASPAANGADCRRAERTVAEQEPKPWPPIDGAGQAAQSYGSDDRLALCPVRGLRAYGPDPPLQPKALSRRLRRWPSAPLDLGA